MQHIGNRLGYRLASSIGCVFLALPIPAFALAFGAVTVKLPPAAELPGQPPSVAQACGICHSGDYITTQPPLTQQQWKSVATTMVNRYGCPISTQDIPIITKWLVKVNGKNR
ncbi:hypothetical protein [Nitrococcus mobilis]|uniref:Cytochrome c domain-containing protein n=1 Tax=Nitrococcus mobilis Nb-231 TaxID=314278 RepID=A4BV40_9GAMM|nr:hypothetical protein [Nitrococcus mobilis]EAR20461.1 hypothetical protein NB231_14071 [Nitrococcus mobilis Nb-231]